MQAVDDIIAINGGVVDCYIDDRKDKKSQATMTVNTRYLVTRRRPDRKGPVRP